MLRCFWGSLTKLGWDCKLDFVTHKAVDGGCFCCIITAPCQMRHVSVLCRWASVWVWSRQIPVWQGALGAGVARVGKDAIPCRCVPCEGRLAV